MLNSAWGNILPSRLCSCGMWIWMCSSTTHSTAQPRKASIAGVRCASMLMCAKAADGRFAGMGSRAGCSRHASQAFVMGLADSVWIL